jgi:hypothetical protein
MAHACGILDRQSPEITMATNQIYTDQELLAELIERNEKRLSESAAIGRSYSIQANILSALRNAAWMVIIQDGKIVPVVKKPERTDPIDPWDRIVRVPCNLVMACATCGGNYNICASRRCWDFVNRKTVLVERSS